MTSHCTARPLLSHQTLAGASNDLTDARAAIAELQLEPVMGARCNLMGEFLEELVRNASGARLVVLDTLSRLHALDENSNGEMAHLVTTLEYVAAETGAAVLYLHHVNKSSAREAPQTSRRPVGLPPSSSRECLRKKSETLSEGAEAIGEERRGFFARVGVSKQNYGRPSVGQKGGGRRDEA